MKHLWIVPSPEGRGGLVGDMQEGTGAKASRGKQSVKAFSLFIAELDVLKDM